jgi:hypothetical protein
MPSRGTLRSCLLSTAALMALTACGTPASTVDAAITVDAGLDAAITVDAGLDAAITVDAGPRASFRVLRRSLAGMVPALEFAVRAESASGVVLDRVTGQDGRVDPALDGIEGAWDLTIARAGCTAVSILGITGALTGDVLVGCPASPELSPAHTILTTVDGVTDYTLGWNFCPGAYLDTAGPHVIFREGQGPLEIWAIQTDSNARGAHLLNFGRSAPITLGSSDLAATIPMHSPAAAVLHATVRVQLPSTGLLLPEHVRDAVAYERLWRGGDDDLALSGSCSVGEALWTPPDASGVGSWAFETFDVEGTAPTTASIPISINDASATIGGELAVHTFTDGDTVVVATVTELPEVLDDPSGPRLRGSADGFDHLAFYAGVIGIEIHGSWIGYTFDGAAIDRALPSLPSAVSLADLAVPVYGPAPTSATLRVSTCGLRMHAGAPWQPGALRDLRACGTSSATFSSL